MMWSALVWGSSFYILRHLFENFHFSTIFEVIDHIFASFKKINIEFSLLEIPFSCRLLVILFTSKLSISISSLLDWSTTIVFLDWEIWIFLYLSPKHEVFYLFNLIYYKLKRFNSNIYTLEEDTIFGYDKEIININLSYFSILHPIFN